MVRRRLTWRSNSGPIRPLISQVARVEPGSLEARARPHLTRALFGTSPLAILEMPFPSALALGEQALMQGYYRYVEPVQIAGRKRSRMAHFGIKSLDEIACGGIDLAASSPHCVPVCAEIVEAHRVYLAKYLFCDGRRISRLWRGIPLVIDLGRYPDFESYTERLKRVGNVVRLTSLMGHGAYLADGVVKLLFAKAMKWLVNREDLSVHGIRHLHYGAIEHGRAGLVRWKQRFGFEPLLFS
jgi:hypothetical protein